ncbi:hypothetical protein [Nocardia sp. NRRL S-836]|uniref:hypothetical protein n=1 Tax=Nocardia sp. NRRL S-836 TaxID=1519492 RepID=UPI0012FBBE66|nr:hypothetical protein [Nocardia sp. NRRL S-836]
MDGDDKRLIAKAAFTFRGQARAGPVDALQLWGRRQASTSAGIADVRDLPPAPLRHLPLAALGDDVLSLVAPSQLPRALLPMTRSVEPNIDSAVSRWCDHARH